MSLGPLNNDALYYDNENKHLYKISLKKILV